MTPHRRADDPIFSISRKLLRVNWVLIALLGLVAAVGYVMLTSVGRGDPSLWAKRHVMRFVFGVCVMLLIAIIDVRLWRKVSYVLYAVVLLLLVGVEVAGATAGGAQRWIDLGVVTLQPSELMKICLVLALARYYHDLAPEKASGLLWMIPPLLMIGAPAALVLMQPDLGTALLLGIGGLTVMFLAGASLWFFAALLSAGVGGVWLILASRGTDWQILKDYQYNRIEVFLDPELAPRGAGYHITQSKIAFGSGGVFGKGYMEGTQSQLNFLPEKHTDFIFTSLAEEWGFVGGLGLLGLYGAIMLVALISTLRINHRFGRLTSGGVTMTFFLYFSINMAMVTGLAPVVGVPLPLVSNGGTSMLAILAAFGLLLSAQVHRDAPFGRR